MCSANCPICQSPESRLYLERCSDFLYGCPGTWSLIECCTCGLVYTFPLPTAEALLGLYPEDYSPHVSVKELKATVYGRLLGAFRAMPYLLRFGSPDWAFRPFGSGRVLDVGCGRGELLRQLAALGWKCWGIDISPLAVAKARVLVPGAEVVQATLEDIHWDISFDLITAVHVIEHMPDPRGALSKIASLLAPGGRLFMSIPNIGSFEAKLFGRYWSGLDIPRHCVHFREGVTRFLLEGMGLSIVGVRPALFASSLSESLISMLPETVRRQVLHSRIARYIYFLAFPFATLSYALGNRGVLEIVAEKTPKERGP